MKRVAANLATRVARMMAAIRCARVVRLIKRSGAFDAPWYQANYPDSRGWDPVKHYVAHGAQKGYLPHALFDPDWWREHRGRKRHKNILVDYLTAPERWALSPSPYLVVRQYSNPGKLPRSTSPLGFYRISSGQEGLHLSPLFDVEYYRRNNPDVVRAGFDPLLHYVSNGGQEGRSPCVSFDTFWYLTVNPDVRARGEEPLRHFLMRGSRQGRAPHRAIDFLTLRTSFARADAARALEYYQTEGRRSLAARSHPRLPPPGAVAPLFDDWPWRNGTAATASKRLLVLVAGHGDPRCHEKLKQVVAFSCDREPWLVALDAAAAEALQATKEPWLDLSHTSSETLTALLRAAGSAGPHLAVTTVAPPDHDAHAKVAEAGFPASGQAHRRPPIASGAPALPRVSADISVVVPSYNHAEYLDARLASILAQRRPPCEIIIIDDASQDESLAIARAFAESAPLPIRVIARDRNSGSPFRAWAEGAQLARGELLWIAESDDIAHPRLLERLAPFLECDSHTVLAYCQSAVIGAQGERLADDHLFYTDEIDPRRWETPYHVPGETEIGQALAIKNTIPNVSAVLFRRQTLAEIASRILSDRYCGDWRAYALLAERGHIGYSPESLNLTRRHGRNATLEGERGLRAIREAEEIRLALWQRPNTPAATIRAGYAQHLREIKARSARLGRSTTESEASEFFTAAERLLKERGCDLH